MATVQEIMIDSIAKAYRAAEQITTNVDRAKAFTELATACASALGTAKSVAEDTAVAAMPPAATPAAKTVKRSSKKAAEPSSEETKPVAQEQPTEPEKTTEPEQPVVQEDKAAETVSDIKEDKVKEQEETEKKTDDKAEENFSDEWTLNALDYFKEEISEMERYQDMFSEDVNSLNKMIQEATEGHCNDVDDITPLNIRLILAFIKNLEEQGQ